MFGYMYECVCMLCVRVSLQSSKFVWRRKVLCQKCEGWIFCWAHLFHCHWFCGCCCCCLKKPNQFAHFSYGIEFQILKSNFCLPTEQLSDKCWIDPKNVGTTRRYRWFEVTYFGADIFLLLLLCSLHYCLVRGALPQLLPLLKVSTWARVLGRSKTQYVRTTVFDREKGMAKQFLYFYLKTNC